ncbi:MAG: dihydrolipoyl dehydrogenase [Gammaproteobacteria bacterium]|nr:dihydrolipoyl dehydrogenase [Gammaproteobacteria bacterium]
MTDIQTIQLPDIGDFDDVEVIEVLVSVGDTVAEETSLLTVESDKASMEIPSPLAGVVTSVLVKTGDKVSRGSDLVLVEAQQIAEKPIQATSTKDDSTAPPVSHSQSNTTVTEVAAGDYDYDVAVIGAGPGGYTAAFRASDLGLKVVLIERYPDLGGVCLNVGCIPSKALLHTAAVIDETKSMEAHGVSFGDPKIDVDKLRGFKESVIGQLTGGLAGLAKQRKVTVVHGLANFTGPHELEIKKTEQKISFKHAIIAAGSQSIKLPGFPYDDERLIDSTGALELADIPNRLLVIGGGIIGLEMGCVYAALGSQVTVVELSEGLMPGCDKDLVRPLQKRLAKSFENIFLGSKVTSVESTNNGLVAHFEGGKAPASDTFDRVLLAIGRSPNGKSLGCEQAGVSVTDRGFIEVDSQQRTNAPHIFAIGDIVGQPMLAHKATHEGKVAAEVIAGMKSYFDAKTIPSVAYTDPEVAWMGLTETQAKDENIAYEKAVFPWAASGRSLSIARNEGFTKLLYDPQSHQILGAGIVGTSAGELIGEAVLALEMGADIQDIALTIHPHPTLSETINFAAEVAEGTVTDIYAPKK